MKYLKPVFFLCLLVSIGCTQAVQTQDVRTPDSIPKLSYITYLYSSGGGERYRAAFLKSPESDAEVIAASYQIIKTTGSFQDAMAFMQHGPGYRKVDVQSVNFKGKTIGYLLTQSKFALGKQQIEADVYERDGKIYFSVRERFYDD